jgi:hypothetical protein
VSTGGAASKRQAKKPVSAFFDFFDITKIPSYINSVFQAAQVSTGSATTSKRQEKKPVSPFFDIKSRRISLVVYRSNQENRQFQ